MTSASEYADAVPSQPSTLPHVPDTPETEHPRTYTPPAEGDTTPIIRHIITAKESMSFKEQSMTANVEGDAEKQDTFRATEQQPSREVNAEFQEGDIVESDPLHNPRPSYFSTDAKEAQGVAMVEEEVDIVNSTGHTLYADLDTKPSPTVGRRTSHLRLDFKPPSPQPWEVVDPPGELSRRDGREFYTVGTSQKFRAAQSARLNRPLIPKSSYYFGPPSSDSAFGTPPAGQIGVHHPREIVRIERDYTGGELIQFAAIYPLEFEGRINPTQFLESINALNELLISAHSLRQSFFDNVLAVFSLQLSRLMLTSHYEKEMERLRYLFDDLNAGLYNPVGLNMLWPRDVAFLFLEIEYY